MASVRNAPSHKRGDKSGLPSIREEHHETSKKNRRELRAIRALGLTAMLDGLGFKGIAGFRHLDPALVTTILLRFAAQQLSVPLSVLGVTP